jgi:hypothetical protein
MLPKTKINKPTTGQEAALELKPKRNIMIYCLYQLQEAIDSTKMELMLHKPGWKDKEL